MREKASHNSDGFKTKDRKRKERERREKRRDFSGKAYCNIDVIFQPPISKH